MSSESTATATRIDLAAIAARLAPDFAARAAAHDAEDAFVTQNFTRLTQERIFSAGVPTELGGGGASHGELCQLLRTLGRACGSTALALSMHTHLVAAMVWRWRHGDKAAEPLLRRVAAEELGLVSSGASDWLEGSGRAEKVDGGFRVTARKIFGSGSPFGKLLLTTAIYDDPSAGPTVLHIPVPLGAPEVKVQDNWRTLGMRGTGSHDIVIEGLFVPDAAVGLRRTPGKWHRFFDIICPLAVPLIMSVYAGIAESARALALEQARRRKDDPGLAALAGEVDTQLAAGQLAVDALVALGANYDFEPALERSNRALIYKTLAARALLTTVEKSMELAGGASFFRSFGLERLFRDIQGARFHPLPERRQMAFTGRLALGLEPG
jgi:alkylation response protein AidB-like acyl-CoA dehydrogenase